MQNNLLSILEAIVLRRSQNTMNLARHNLCTHSTSHNNWKVALVKSEIDAVA